MNMIDFNFSIQYTYIHARFFTGHNKGDTFVVVPKLVTAIHKKEDKIVYVDACDSATLVATKQVYMITNSTTTNIININS